MIDFSSNEMMRDAMKRALTNAGRDSNKSAPLWIHTKHIFSLGTDYAIALCLELGFDPDEMRGGLDVSSCQECGLCQDSDCHAGFYDEHSDECEASRVTS